MLELNLMTPHTHVNHHPDGEQVHQHGITPVAHKRQGQTGNRHDTESHTHVDKDLENNHGGNTCAEKSTEAIFGKRADF